MNSALLLIDFQNDYFPGGNMELIGIDEATENAQKLLNEFRKSQLPVIHIQHISSRPGATFFLPDTDGAKIHRTVAPQDHEMVVVKNFPNSFRATALREILQEKKIDKLVICGAMSHMCIDATTRAAFDLGFTCRVAEDACATRDLTFKARTIKAADVHAAFMAALATPYAQVLATQEIIDNSERLRGHCSFVY